MYFKFSFCIINHCFFIYYNNFIVIIFLNNISSYIRYMCTSTKHLISQNTMSKRDIRVSDFNWRYFYEPYNRFEHRKQLGRKFSYMRKL